jgi:hypothetical protein
MLYILSKCVLLQWRTITCVLLQWHTITCFYTIHIYIVFKIYRNVRSNVNANCVMLFLLPAHITAHKTHISWPQLADFLRLRELELVSWDVRPCSLTARSLDDPSNQTAGHHITSQQPVTLLLTTMTIESWVSCILNHTQFINLNYSTSSWDTVDGIATNQWLGSPGFKSRKRQYTFSSPKRSKLVPGPTQCPMLWVCGFFAGGNVDKAWSWPHTSI